MIIRPVNLSDADELAAPLSELGAVTFTESFGHLYSAHDLAFFVKKNHSEAAYRQALADPEQFIWTAILDDGLIGYISLCPNHLPCEPQIPDSIELARLYVRASHHSQGIGQKLLDAAIGHIRGMGIGNVVLSVWSKNFGGHRFYGRNGFEKIGEYLFPVGEQLDQEWIMRKRM